MDHSRKFPAFSTSKFKMIWDAEGARCYAHQVCSHIRVEIRESRHLSVLIHPGEKSGFLILVVFHSEGGWAAYEGTYPADAPST